MLYAHRSNDLKCDFFEKKVVAYLFGENGNVFVEGLGGADVTPGHGGIARGTSGKFTFFKNQSQQREEGMPEIDIRDVLLRAIT